MYASHSYSKGIADIGNIIRKTKIIPDYINIGGGFPAIYPDLYLNLWTVILKK